MPGARAEGAIPRPGPAAGGAAGPGGRGASALAQGGTGSMGVFELILISMLPLVLLAGFIDPRSDDPETDEADPAAAPDTEAPGDLLGLPPSPATAGSGLTGAIPAMAGNVLSAAADGSAVSPAIGVECPVSDPPGHVAAETSGADPDPDQPQESSVAPSPFSPAQGVPPHAPSATDPDVDTPQAALQQGGGSPAETAHIAGRSDPGASQPTAAAPGGAAATAGGAPPGGDGAPPVPTGVDPADVTGSPEFGRYAARDPLLGGPGNDTLHGTDASEAIFANGLDARALGDNLVIGGGGNDTLLGGLGSDTLVGGSGDNLIRASYSPELEVAQGSDLFAWRDNGQPDIVQGGPGDDRLIFARGDVASGGGGSNVFEVWHDPTSPQPAAIVTDFAAGSDRLDIVVRIDEAAHPDCGAWAWDRVVQASHFETAQVEIAVDTATGRTEVLVDGEVVARLLGAPPLNADALRVFAFWDVAT